MKILKFLLLLLFISLSNYAANPGSAQNRSCVSCPGACSSCPIPSFACPTGGSGGSTGSTGPCANFCCINVSQSSTIAGSLTVSCETITGNLTVGGSALIQGSLIVEGNSDFKGNVCAEQNLTVGGNATIGGNETIGGSLNVNNGAFINGPLVVNGNETVNGSVLVTLNETVNGNLAVGGTGVFNGLLSANGGLVVSNGETINNGGLIILSGGANITGDVVIVGNETVDNLDVLGNLTVDENAFFNGCNTTVNGTFIANGPVIMNRGLNIVSGNETITTGGLTLNVGNLSVGGLSTFSGPLTANGGATINNGLTVFGGETIATGNLTVATCGNVTIGGSLTVANTITSPSAATLSDLTLTDTTNSTSPTTGTLVVDGGVGIAMDLWIGGCEYFEEVIREGGTPSCFDYYEEACVPMVFEFGATTATATIQIVRIGNLVNLLIPSMTFGPGTDTVHSLTTLPPRFAPACVVRGAASTIVDGAPSQLGEFEVDPSGIIIFGIPGPALGPQPFTSITPAMTDINTITYNRLPNCTSCP